MSLGKSFVKEGRCRHRLSICNINHQLGTDMLESDNYLPDSILLVVTQTTCTCGVVHTSSEAYTIFRPVSSEKRSAVRQLIQGPHQFDPSLPRGRSTLRKSTFTCAECFDTYRINEKAEQPFTIDHSPSAFERFNQSVKRLERESNPATRKRIVKEMVSSSSLLNLDDFTIIPNTGDSK